MSNYGVIAKGEYLHKQSNEFLHVDRYLILRRKAKRYLLLDFENLHTETLSGMTLQIDQLDARGHSLGFINVEFNALNFPKGKFILKEKIKVHGACLDFKVKILRAEYGECVYHLGDNNTFATLEKKKINKPIDRKTAEKEVGKEGYACEARQFKTPVFIGVFALILAIVCFAAIFLHLASFGKHEDTFFISNLEYAFVSDDKTEEDGVYVIGSVGLGGQDIVVPSTVEGYPVKWIETGAFDGNSKIKTLTVNGDVKINGGAFKNCKNLNTVTLNGVSLVGVGAFAECKKLETFTANRLTTLSDKAFENCVSLSNVQIKDVNTANVLTINGHPFIGCEDVNTLTIDQFVNYGDVNEFFVGITSVNELFLKNYDYSEYDTDKTPERALMELFEIAEPVEDNGADDGEDNGDDGADNGTDGGADVTPLKVSPREQISEDISISKVTIDYMDYIPKAFARDLKTSLSSFTVGHLKEETVGDQAFLDCAFLSEVNFPVKITAIGAEAFKSTAITTFDASVLSTIGVSAFENCTSLSSVTTASTTPLTIIAENAFKDCTALSSFGVPSGVLDIEKAAFKSSGLTKIEFYENCAITAIKESVFENCEKLTEITIPSEVAIIGTSAFGGCSVLAKVVFPEKLSSIGVGSFMGCVAMETFNLPAQLLSIGAYAFSGCSKLTAFTVPDSVISLGAGAFNQCNLESITLPFIGSAAENATYKNIGYAFAEAEIDGTSVTYKTDNSLVPESLKTITLTKGIEVPSSAFKDCKYVTTFNLPTTVKKIQSSAFEGCAAIRTIVLPDGLVEILDLAFKSCVNLRTITLTSSITAIDQTAFDDCFRLFEIVDACQAEIIKGFGVAKYALAVYDGKTDYQAMPKVEVGGFVLAKTLDTEKWYVIDHSVTGDIVLPDNPEDYTYNLPYKYFYNDETITSVVLSNEIVWLGDNQFADNTALKSAVFVAGSNKINIGSGTFAGCDALETLDIVGRELESCSFTTDTIRNCTSLKNIALPSGMTEITEGFFRDNTKLENIELASTIKTVENNAFNGCVALKTAVLHGAETIGENAFSGCNALTSIDMPCVETIGVGAFNGCLALTSVNLNIVTEIKENTFSGCGALTTVSAYNLSQIQESAFSGCISLVNFYGNKLSSIADNAFNGCKALSNINLSSVITIGSYAFNECASLGNVYLENIESIGERAFANCSSLGDVTLPSYLDYVGTYAFSGAFKQGITVDMRSASIDTIPQGLFENARISVVKLPTIITEISLDAFKGCSSLYSINWSNLYNLSTIGSYAFSGSGLYSVSLPSSLTSLGFNVFSGCTSLTSVSLVSSISSIPYQAFSGCTSLEDISIPSNVTNISQGAFNGCSSLSSVTFSNGTKNLAIADAYSTSEYVFGGTAITSFNTNNRVSYIGSNAFYDVTTLGTVNLSGVTSLGSYVFSGCTSLYSVILGSNIKTIPSGAFNGCTSLPAINLYNVTTIDTYAFSGCSGLEDVTFGSGVTIYSNAFVDCVGLTELEIHYAYTINENAFSGCTNLIEVDLTGTDYVDAAFNGCTSLKTLDLSNVTTVYESAFKDMTSIEEVNLSGASTIQSHAFYGCEKLSDLTLTNVTSIGSSAFNNCTSLTELTLPSNGTIGASAFANCSALKYVVLPYGLTSNKINSTSFSNCYNLREVCELTSSSLTLGSTSSFGNVGYYAVKVYTSSNPTRLKDGTTSDGFVCLYNTNECFIVGYTGNATTLKFNTAITVGGRTYNNYKIASFAFRDRYDIKTLYVEDNVTSVGINAFPSVTKLVLDTGVTVKSNSFGSNYKYVYYRGSSSCPYIESVYDTYYYVDCVHTYGKWTEGTNGEIITTPAYATTTVNPTCTENGYERSYCPKCDYEYSKTTLYATGHNYYNHLCRVCNHVEGYNLYSYNYNSYNNILTFSADGFEWGNTSSIKSTITEKGSTASITIRASVDIDISFYVYATYRGADNTLKIQKSGESTTSITSNTTKNYTLNAGQTLTITYTIGEDSTATNPYVYLSSIYVSNP